MTPLEDLVRILEPPVTFLTQERSNIARTVLPVGVITGKIDRLLLAGGDGEVEKWLREIKDLLSKFQEAPGRRKHLRERREALLRIASLLAEIKKEPSRPKTARYEAAEGSIGQMLESLQTPVQYVKGVGPRRAEQLEKMGIKTVEDLIYHLPFRYEDRREVCKIGHLRSGQEGTVLGAIVEVSEGRRGRGGRVLEALVSDGSGSLRLVWYHQLAYFRSRYGPGQRVLVHGKAELRRGRLGGLRMVHPEVETAGASEELEVGGLVPVYNKPTQMSVAMMRKIVKSALEGFIDRIPSALPLEVARRRNLMSLGEALRYLHRPPRDADVALLNRAGSPAHRSVVYDELFYLQLGMAIRRRSLAEAQGVAFHVPSPRAAALLNRLPFRLTGAQQRVAEEIERDMASKRPMNRLVQGDVGSGKTVVALLAALIAIDDGYQVAMMVPTELLAEQHYETLRRLGSMVGVRTAFLTGAIQGRPRTRMEAALERGDVDLVVGTHALIQEGVAFRKLGLVIIDEQHRFGVMQRAALRRHGFNPDTLLLTATPIPRTLALTVYGDLDVSSLDELPPGRKPVVTRVCREQQRGQVYQFVRQELDAGRQAYIVCPLIEQSESEDLRSATGHAEELSRTVLKGYRVGLMHGRMRAEEKEAAMRSFKLGGLQCLVSTTVIEVGIDVPNATVMVIEHAERFGLAQLHQLRGRVGRGESRSLCFLLAGYAQGDEARRRLRVMEETSDGFRIAEEDLMLRGPGEFLGTRQSGLPDFRAANIVRDAQVLAAARDDAVTWLAANEKLDSAAARRVREVLEDRWAGRLELARVG